VRRLGCIRQSKAANDDGDEAIHVESAITDPFREPRDVKTRFTESLGFSVRDFSHEDSALAFEPSNGQLIDVTTHLRDSLVITIWRLTTPLRLCLSNAKK
jgi:hypothetical protein